MTYTAPLASTAPSAPTIDIEQENTPSTIRAAQTLSEALSRGRKIDAGLLRDTMEEAYGQSDSSGAWVWKLAYESAEAAQVLFLKRFLPTILMKAASPLAALSMIEKIGALIPTHTRRSEDAAALQQFSTPMDLAFAVAHAAALKPGDVVLEPSAGTGQLAVHAHVRGAHLHLNEIAPLRADILDALFPHAGRTRFNAEQIHDYLDRNLQPSVVLMNPPFSSSPKVVGTHAGIDLKHLRSALMRLAPGGRLVAITSQSLSPNNPTYAAAFEEISKTATVRLTAPLAGHLFARHGTTMPTRITVIDKVVTGFDPGVYTGEYQSVSSLIELLDLGLPERSPCSPTFGSEMKPAPVVHQVHPTIPHAVSPPAVPTIECEALQYEVIQQGTKTSAVSDALYQAYAPERIRFKDAYPHPTKLVQSIAMASVLPPIPTYKPHLPSRIVSDGLLSDAQLESVVYAGEAHAKYLAGSWMVDDTLDTLRAAGDGDEGSVRFRRGWFLGDGTGAGKGRQVAGIVLDNWMQGRRKALWISKSDKLLEDAQRDWSALGQEKLLVVPQDRYRQGTSVKLQEGILFTTYATLRSAEREGKRSRLDQILAWVGRDFDGVIIFDEAHAMGNAAGSGSDRGQRAASRQGLAGLKLQHALPHARVVYVSATGATTVENLAYAQRLGLWGSDDLPFETRGAFVSAMLEGGIASSEVLARDLKALGLYMARSLSYEGVQVDMLEHALTSDQVHIYDQYAAAYQIIHQNLDEALQASNITGESGTLNKVAKSAARSAFESCKQRFFNHLITAMKVPTLIRSIEADMEDESAAIIQLVSTSEALMDRRLADIPPSDWGDLSFDITPREYVIDYLRHSFPTQLYEIYTDDNDNLQSRPVYIDGHPVHCREAEASRDTLIEHLSALPPVQSALDQLIHHFGEDSVAEITGRSRRILKRKTPQGMKLAVQNRPGSANISETQAFMDDKKRILVFSDAGGTGRSYHADLASLNQRPRVHYMLEAGWKADAAIQGLGRSNRTNQKQPPVFRPVTTDVRGEKRFLSTIARRLDSLGAITRGQRQTGGQGLFRASDNLESIYARDALRQFYRLLYSGKLSCISLRRFEEMTGLKLTDQDGTLREDLPPIHTFLNRVLALQINLQNALFEEFENLLTSRIDCAIAAGRHDIGLETITAESLVLVGRRIIATNANGAETEILDIARKDRNKPLTLTSVLLRLDEPSSLRLMNPVSGRAALQVPTSNLTLEDGTVERRVRLLRPMDAHAVPLASMGDTHWTPCDAETFARLWQQELEQIPAFTTTRFHLVTGLLLPIWKRLPFDNPRVYRFTTDDGMPFIGRLVPPEHLPAFEAPDAPPLTAEEAWSAVLDGRSVPLQKPMELKRVTAMNKPRIELAGFTANQLPGLKAMGLFSEIIAWRTRLFVPTSDEGKQVITRLLAKYPKHGV